MSATDEDLESQLCAYAAELDRSSELMDGPAIRRLVDQRSGSTPWHGRSLIAAAAAVILVGLVGSIAGRAFDSNIETDASAPGVTSPTSASGSGTADLPSPSPEGATSTSQPSAAGIPFPVKPSHVGPAAARYLPPLDTGYTVETATQLVPFSTEPRPDSGFDRVQLDTIPAVDPADRRAVIIVATTFESVESADEHMAILAELEGRSPIAVGDRTGSWWEVGETWAPNSDNIDRKLWNMARVRFDAQTIIDISTLDIAREQVAELIGAAEQSADGTITYLLVPQGFSSGLSTTMVGLWPDPPPFLPHNVDLLEVGLRHESSGAALTIRSFTGRSDDYRIDEPAHNVQTLEIDGVMSFRWVQYSLFRELTLTWVLPDIVIELTDSSGERSIDELLAIADSLEPVEDETAWADRLRRASLSYVPSGPPTPD